MREIFKRATALMLAGILALSLVACSKNNDNDASEIETLTSFNASYGVDGDDKFMVSIFHDIDGGITMFYSDGEYNKRASLTEADVIEINNFIKTTEILDFTGIETTDGDFPYATTYTSYDDGRAYQTSVYGTMDDRLKNSMEMCYDYFSEYAKDFEVVSVVEDHTNDQDTDAQEEEPIDVVGLEYLNKVVDSATEKGLNVRYGVASNGFNYQGMAKFYSGLDEDDTVMNSVEQITAYSSELSTTAYQLVLIGVNNTDSLEDIKTAVTSNMDWHKYVCVEPSNAAVFTYEIPESDRQDSTAGFVILLMGDKGDTFEPTYDALVDFTGENAEVLNNPSLE